ncbi:hypothetical protein Tco_0883397 [Tanacetum coccineum]
MVINSPYYSVYEELASPEQTATGKDYLKSCCMAVTVGQKLLGASSLVSAACVAAAKCLYFVPAALSILLLRKNLSRNWKLTESTPSLWEECWDKLQKTKCRLCCYQMFVSADSILKSVPR